MTRDADWEPWILYVLRGIEETAAWTTAKVRAIRTLLSISSEHALKTQPKSYSRELIELIFEQPYCRITNLVDAGIAARQAASRYLNALASSGILEERTVGREKLWVRTRLMTLLTKESNEVKPYAT